MKSWKNLLALFLVSTGLNCFEIKPKTEKETITSVVASVFQPTYGLEELLDTEIRERALALNVYIQDSEKLWDYHEYREELFGYVRRFFKKQKVNCQVSYSNSPFNNFSSCNEFGIEILDSDIEFLKRYYELKPEDRGKSAKEIFGLQIPKGRAITKKGIALINGSWEEFREESSRSDKEWYTKFDKEHKMSVKEVILKNNAANICHETLHCLGLWLPYEFPMLFPEYDEEGTNIMSYYPPKFTKKYPEGYKLEPIQVKMIHSFLAGKNTYRAFVDSGRDLDVFLERIGKENNLALENN